MLLLKRRAFMAAATGATLRATAASGLERHLGITTDEIDDDPAVAAAFLTEFHLPWAEVRNVWGQYNTVQPVEKIHELRRIFDERAIQCSVLGTGFFKVPLPPGTPAGRAALDAQWTLLDRAFERARILGTTKIRVFGFTYADGEKPDPANYGRIFELLNEAARRAAEKGFQLALENVSGSYIATGAQAAQLLKAVKHEALGLTWDPNNAGMAGEQAFPDGYKLLDPARIYHVHLRDYRKTAAGKVEWCAVGEGEMDNLGQLRALLTDGYRANFTLETHYKSPLGKAHATRTSLNALLRVLEEV